MLGLQQASFSVIFKIIQCNSHIIYKSAEVQNGQKKLRHKKTTNICSVERKNEDIRRKSHTKLNLKGNKT